METDSFNIRGTPKISPEGKIIGYGVKPVEMPRGDMSGEDHSSKYKAMIESFNPQQGYAPGSISANPMLAPTNGVATLQQSVNSPASSFKFLNPSLPMSSGAGPVGSGFEGKGSVANVGGTFNPLSSVANPRPATPTQQAPGFIDSAKQMVSNVYNKAVDGVASVMQPAVNKMMGVGDSVEGLKKTTGVLTNSIQANPQNVTQSTYDGLATANRQIARNEGTPIPAGVPATGNIVNAPVPQGMPAPVPMASLPGAIEAAKSKGFVGPSADEMAAFRKQTGTAFNPKSINDKLSLERMRGGEETFDSKQANAYRKANPEYRPGAYSRA
jgi:hypothetical protein